MMTLTLLLAGAGLAAAMGLYDAWTNKRGVMGWIVSIIVSVVAGVFVGVLLPQLVILGLRPGDSIILWVGLTSVVIGVLAGSSLALWLVNRFR